MACSAYSTFIDRNILICRKVFGSGVLRRVKKAGSELMNKVPTKNVSVGNAVVFAIPSSARGAHN